MLRDDVTIELDGGKYTMGCYPDGTLYCLRYGELWMHGSQRKKDLQPWALLHTWVHEHAAERAELVKLRAQVAELQQQLAARTEGAP